LFVDCVPYHWTEELIKMLFESYGKVRSTRTKKPAIISENSEFLIQNHMSSVTQIAYVDFVDPAHAEAARIDLNGKKFDMKALRISYFEGGQK